VNRTAFGTPPLWARALLGAAKGAGLGFFLWLASRGIGTMYFGPATVSGDWLSSLLRLLPGWLPLICSGAALGALINTLAGVVNAIRSRGQTALMQQVADSLGLRYVPDGSSVALGDAVTLRKTFDAGARDSLRVDHVFTGVYEDCPLSIADYTETHRANGAEGIESSTWRCTVCVVLIDDLPDFSLAPRTLLHRLLPGTSAGELTFAADQLPSQADCEVVRQFTFASRLKGVDLDAVDSGGLAIRSPQQAAAAESRTRRLFTPTVMQALLPFSQWSVQARAGQLAIWHKSGFSSAKERAELARAAMRIRTILIDGLQAPSPAEIPATSSEAVQTRRTRMVAARIGGAAGAILGFFVGFGAFVTIFFDRDVPLPTAIQMVCFFLCPTAGLTLGGWLGALVGSRLGPKFTSAGTANVRHQPRNNPWTAAGAIAGFVLGGLAGLGLLALIDSRLRPDQIPMWLVLPAFFACPITGLVAGALAVTRLQTRRAKRAWLRQNDKR
jgi:hypothetical protein